MAIVVASGSAVSIAANTKSSDQVSGVNQFVGKGTIQLIARSSATGMNCTLAVNGVPLIDDSVIPYTGTAGAISANDHLVVSQAVNGGRVQFFLRNTTAGAVTADYLIYFTPSK